VPFLPLILFLSGAFSSWLAFHVRRHGRTPGSGTFAWLLAAISAWCLVSSVHAAVDSLEAKLAWARVQYFAICSVPALTLMFALEFEGSRWLARRRTLAFIWTIPALTMVAVFTNEWHGAHWPSVTLGASGLAVYEHGWWFWLSTGHAYVMMLLSTIVIAGALRRSPPPYRGQFVALLAGAVLPWAGNLAYLAGLVPIEGLDITPLMFAASGALFTHALYRNHLFDLVPVARDQIVDSLADAVVVLDSSQRVLDLNAAARRLVAATRPGHEPSSGTGDDRAWFGRTLDELMPFLADARLREGFRAEAGSFAIVDEQSSGGTRHYDVQVTPVRTAASRPYSVSPRDATGDAHYAGVVAWAVLLRDVTEQREAQAEREALEKRVQEQQKRESLSVLAGGLAHDFNNLLAGILGNADLLAMQVPRTGDMPGHVGAIILGAQRAADLVSKMLAYAGERQGASEVVDLDVIVREMLDLLEASVARHCTLRYAGSPVKIFADPVQIRQVAMNLIINAAEAVDESAGLVTVRVGVERLSPWQLAGMHTGDDAPAGAYAFLEVRDNGPGMDEATIDQIFTPFYTTKPAGHGLGLAAVQGIVRGHRGALRVDTRPGEGARFRVWLPLAERSRRADVRAYEASDTSRSS
jgi:signal transduction histidine kinase